FMKIDAKGMHYKELNKIIRSAANNGEQEFDLLNVNGQRYIGDGIDKKIKINIYGTPGNDLAMFMNGPTIIVHANGQDGIGNTMNAGKVIVHGDAGDVIGYGMRGGKIYIKGDVGYRVGIHMKSYKKQVPVIIAGGTAGDFYGEYMAGGIMILLNLNKKNPYVGDYVGTGMHGGVIYIRGEVEEHQLGKEVSVLELDQNDEKELRKHLEDYCKYFDFNIEEIMSEKFIKLLPLSHRPYGNLYAY
ncbi:MAG: hypothetical protein ACE5J9_10820, partial [Methanosarcinales archaeon]